ncbi:MAG: glycosyltransferase family 2 protein [Candidatus Omnitrophica bacterium]|nr:glycosyltransferase family 2 protein [Candidatus Omnitrophota bacterium]
MVSVIIVAYAREDYINKCLASVVSQSYPRIETLVVDNSLNPKIREIIRDAYPDVRLFVQDKNIFYGAALNIGIRHSRGDYILCLNDDVALDKFFIEKALKGFSICENVGMVSGKILRPDRATIDSAGLFLSLWCAPRERGYGSRDAGAFDKEGFIFGVNGAVAFYRRKTLDAIRDNDNYFDTDLSMFYEDLDIAWRAQNAGWRCYYVPEALAIHTRGASWRPSHTARRFASLYLNDNLHTQLIKNRYLAIIKNISLLGLVGRLPFILFHDLLIWLYIVVFKPRLIKLFFYNAAILKKAVQKRFSVGKNG